MDSHIEQLRRSGELDAFDGIADIVGEFTTLPPEVVFGERSSTLGADGTLHIVQPLDFAGGLEGLRAALCAAKRDVVGHA